MNNPTKDLQELDLQGNVIPHNWFNALKMENGSPDYQSIILLSEIVYWYRPKVKFDDDGIAIGYTKKYKEDILQKSYDDLSKKFGMTKRQVRDSIVRLEERGLIKRVFRNLVVKGMAVNNVLYIELYVDKLKEITKLNDVTISDTSECSNSSEGIPFQGYTNTKSTSKNTTNKNNSLSVDKSTDHIELVVNKIKELKNLPQPKEITTTRRGHIKARIDKYGIDEVLESLEYFNNTDLVKNAIKERKEKTNKNGWYTFDWIFNPNNFVKIAERKYIVNEERKEIRMEDIFG